MSNVYVVFKSHEGEGQKNNSLSLNDAGIGFEYDWAIEIVQHDRHNRNMRKFFISKSEIKYMKISWNGEEE